jgi:hypothetical protein
MNGGDGGQARADKVPRLPVRRINPWFPAWILFRTGLAAGN